MSSAIEFENVSKQYRLGLVSTGTFSHDLNRWWTMNVLHKEDPNLKIGETNDRTQKGDSKYVWALKDINFKVEQGDVVGIIGKNGAGKSTLLKLLSRVTTPTTGEIRVRGRIASLLEVGTGFHPEMTGRENIFMNGAIMGMTKQEIGRKLDEIIDFSGCERYIDTPVKRYSSGMTVRLGFAIAAHLEPEILVVDEVLAVGDAEFQKKAIGKMQDISRGQGRTVLFVSHNMAAVRNLCKSGIVLRNGQLYYEGGVEDAVSVYMKSGLDSYSMQPIKDLPRARKTNGMVKFTDLKYLDDNDQPTSPRCGQFLRLRLYIDVVESGAEIENISVDFLSVYGDPIMTFPSEMTMNDFHVQGGKQCINLDITKLPLTAGVYRMGLWCKVKNTCASTLCADYIDNLIRFEVEGDDYFNNGKQVAPHLTGKVVLCDYNWKL